MKISKSCLSTHKTGAWRAGITSLILIATVPNAASAGIPTVPVLDNISGAALSKPTPSWMEYGNGAPPFDGQFIYHTFAIAEEEFVTSVEAAVSLGVEFEDADFYLVGTLIHLDGPNAGAPRATWSTTPFPGTPAIDLVEDGVAPDIHLYGKSFGIPFGLDPGSYAVAIYAFRSPGQPSSPDPDLFHVLQSSVGDASGFVAPPSFNFPPGQIDFTEWQGQGLNAAIRVNVYDIPAPGSLAVVVTSGAGLVARRRCR